MKGKKVNQILKVWLAVILICGFIAPVYAADNSSSNDEYEQMMLDNATKCLNGEEHNHSLCGNDITESSFIDNDCASIQTTSTCSKCGGIMALVCNKDASEYARGTHTYSVNKTCTVVYMRSRSKWVCYSCGNYKWYYNDSGTALAYHDCWQVHQNCGKGQYHVCPMDS